MEDEDEESSSSEDEEAERRVTRSQVKAVPSESVVKSCEVKSVPEKGEAAPVIKRPRKDPAAAAVLPDNGPPPTKEPQVEDGLEGGPPVRRSPRERKPIQRLGINKLNKVEEAARNRSRFSQANPTLFPSPFVYRASW